MKKKVLNYKFRKQNRLRDVVDGWVVGEGVWRGKAERSLTDVSHLGMDYSDHLILIANS